jgi:2-C-methyl-D-erythritol 2,4-cyclodiphosphate synthase
MTVLRVGLGYDSHRLAPGGSLRLGGLDIPFDHHLVGHSDADVLLHAVTDALLGAAAMGDIGEMFPNTDEVNRDRDSGELLQLAYATVKAEGYRVVNLDCIVHAERPKLSPYKRDIARRIAEFLEVPPDQVSVKAKTGEGVGVVGQQEAMVAQCIALLERIE